MIEIKNYAVRINGGISGAGEFLRAQIHLFDGGNKLAGFFNFYDTSGPGSDKNENGVIQCSMNIDRLNNMVDLLRNEKPIFLGWNSSNNHGFISTTQEPVGEGE